MNLTEFQERISYCQRELAYLQTIEPNCTRCAQKDVTAPVCKKYGPIPADYISKGCAEWEFDDVPF